MWKNTEKGRTFSLSSREDVSNFYEMFSCHCSRRLFQPLGQVVSPAAGKVVHVTEVDRVVVVEGWRGGGVGGRGGARKCPAAFINMPPSHT